MPEFDPRRQPVRFGPTLLTVGLAAWVGGMVMGAPADPVHAEARQRAAAPTAVLTKASLPGAKKTAAVRAAPPAPPPPPVYEEAETVQVKLRKGETLEAAVVRAGCAPEEAAKAAGVVLAALKDESLEPGLRFEAEVSAQRGREDAGRLVGLSMRPKPERLITLARTEKGELALSEKEEKILQQAALVEAEMRGSLYATAQRAGISGGAVKEIVKAFAAKLDFERDIKAGDRFRLVFDQKRTESGAVIENGRLLYAEIKAKGKVTRFYRFERADGKVQWLDESGTNLKSYLLRTPVEGARMSSGFGMRRHPILGYHKMHQGVDFAAGSGTPVMAAGDGTVVEIRRWGGYGNWLRIRHAGGYESGYAHLSRYAKGLSVGDKVKQGEVVAYVGSTGRSTGPHLHHEIWLKGRRVDPKGAKIPSGGGLESREMIAFKAQKKKVDAALAKGDVQLAGKKTDPQVAGLRSAQNAA
jgi:murein DD-endopeptidase MepM/ murein hydrolase activator NlpD